MGLGWHAIVYKQKDGTRPAAFDTDGDCVHDWSTGVWGLNWLDDLVKADKAVSLGGNGYPIRYTAKTEDLIPKVPELKGQCLPGEWLIVEAWDQS